MKKLILFLAFSLPVWGAACPSNNWCVIYDADTAGPLTHYSDAMWNSLLYNADANLTYLWMNAGGGLTPESNGLFAYSAQCQTASASCPGTGTTASPELAAGVNPWQGISQCGDDGNSKTLTNRQGNLLAESITATTGTCASGCTATDYIHLTNPSGKNIPDGTGPINAGNTVNGSGVVWIGNEAVRYGRCTATNSFTGAVCSTTSGPEMYLWGTNDGTSTGTQAALIRHTRSNAGYSSTALAHQGLCANGVWPCTPQQYGEAAGWDCYEPQLGNFVPDTPAWSASPTNTDFTDVAVSRAGSWSHPSDRHFAAESSVYDSTRGRVWVQQGWQEAWQQQDTWSLCVTQKSTTNGTGPLDKCGPGDLYTAPTTTKGWQRITWPGTNPVFPLYTWGHNFNTQAIGSQNSGIVESAAIYDPQNDVIVEMGGSATTSRHEILIFCMATISTGYGCSSGNVGTWLVFQPTTSLSNCSAAAGFYCGDTGPRDASRLVIDPVSHRILQFGGNSGAYVSNTVVQFDAHTGDVCLSDTVTDAAEPGGPPANSPRSLSYCPLPNSSAPATVNAPPEKNGSGALNCGLRFPDWAYNSGLGLAEFYGGNGTASTGNCGTGGLINDPSVDGIWFYNPTTNIWTRPALSGTAGPALPAINGHNSWTYDSGDKVSIQQTSQSLWQVPDTALGGSAPSTFILSVTLAGTGQGTATDTATGFSCGSGTCTHSYTSGTSVTLTPTPVGNSTFVGWSGDCSGINLCVLTMSANHSITATFNPAVRTTQDTTFRTNGTYKQ